MELTSNVPYKLSSTKLNDLELKNDKEKIIIYYLENFKLFFLARSYIKNNIQNIEI